MEKAKWNYIVYIVIFCSVIAIGCGYYLGTMFGSTKEVKVGVAKNDVYANKDIYDLVVEDTLNTLIDALNGNNTSKKSCQVFKQSNLQEYRFSNKEYDFLNAIAPYIASCMVGYELVSINNYEIMNEVQYLIYQDYFNARLDLLDDVYDRLDNKTGLESYLHEDNYLAIKYTDDYTIDIKYSIGNITHIGDKYQTIVTAIDPKTNDVYHGDIVLSFKNGHIYYEKFMMNTKN